MEITARRGNDILSSRIADSFYHHAVLLGPQLRTDKISLQFGRRHDTILEDGRAIIRINPEDTVFQDADTINPFVFQEMARLTVKDALPQFLEDILCGRETAKRYPKEYFQLCYLEMLKCRQARNLQEFLSVNRHWIIFYPTDRYNSDFLKRMADKIKHDRKLDILCTQLFDSAKNNLSSSENLNKAARAYENLSGKHAGNQV